MCTPLNTQTCHIVLKQYKLICRCKTEKGESKTPLENFWKRLNRHKFEIHKLTRNFVKFRNQLDVERPNL